MKLITRWIVMVVVSALLMSPSWNYIAYADEASKAPEYGDGVFEFDVLPARYIFVDGNVEKFKAHHWMNNNYAAGLKDFYAFYEGPDDITIKMEAQAVPQNNEYVGDVTIKKKDIGYVKFDYQEFRKYYDNMGGVHQRFLGYRGGENALANQNKAPNELALDIGHFGVETGLRMKGYPEVTLGYEREFRNGSKSRLRWGTVVDSGNTGLSRKIAPAFSEISEKVDKFDIKVEDTVKGFELKSEQQFEQVRIDQTTTELQFGPDGDKVPNNHYILKQHIMPESKSFNSVLQAARWFLKEKVYASSGYRFSVIKAQEWEDTREYDENLNPFSTGTNSETRPNSRSDSSLDSNSWVQNAMYWPTRWLSMGAKLKTEFAKRHGESNYNRVLNSTAQGVGSTDGIIDNTLVSDVASTQQRWGENFSVRFSAIPRTAIYSELELEQSRVPTAESRVQVNKQTVVTDVESFTRETITQTRRGVWTLGARMTPLSFVDFTSHFRHLLENTTYNDIQEKKAVISSNAFSAFFAGQQTETNEFLTRMGLKLTRFFQPSARFVHRETRYITSFERDAFSDQPSVPTGMDSNNYILDITSQPLADLMTMASFSHLSTTTWTPAKDALLGLAGNVPAFESGVNTYNVSVSYSPRKNLSLINSFSYARAANFDNYSDRGIPLGADYTMMNIESGIKFGLMNDKIMLEPKYALYHYNANGNVDSGDYMAHLLSVELNMAWG